MQIIDYLKSKYFLKVIVKMLIITLLLIFILRYWLNCTTNHSQKIEVPNLAKMSILKVKVVLDNLDLNYELQDAGSYNPDYPVSSVIEQTPEAGDFVKEGRKIYITLNKKAYRDIKLPKLLGKTKRHVESELISLGFKIGTFSYVPDRGRNVVRGLRFKGKRISEGDMIPKNSKINLIIGDGKG
ncbi:MAG: PASTA domain-containing protein [Flavobacteriaceae bacterium]|nr:PASTA domain-containing protein [Flavobacteriaceae bacterium]